MTEKNYDILFDSDGWCCHVNGKRIASFPSWGLAIGAVCAAAEKARRKGIKAVIRYQDLKGEMHTLAPEAAETAQPPRYHDPKTLSRIDRLAGALRSH